MPIPMYGFFADDCIAESPFRIASAAARLFRGGDFPTLSPKFFWAGQKPSRGFA
jgi:hypothetical protein